MGGQPVQGNMNKFYLLEETTMAVLGLNSRLTRIRRQTRPTTALPCSTWVGSILDCWRIIHLRMLVCTKQNSLPKSPRDRGILATHALCILVCILCLRASLKCRRTRMYMHSSAPFSTAESWGAGSKGNRCTCSLLPEMRGYSAIASAKHLLQFLR